ncbi:uncharacterized protein Z519_12190 [Cladophialophora bantiana CBS 173.52]|uniref:Major facilitator superfamily (MFS) profile domain-containing protein n=1 Tax=Cladophialophora bantiana (strain ATCC 10958 / CBS 173.52 / CDC B-1940 / NIH 8579) TaxID=1442370 RepID=A0A0D2FKR6_CLAB1|nr:uncharacterized protein Z519_12190 [Cladophialophora bantiana CBS 173.52]KIW87287.1 hypothetical protein Z519_12190 [Cladophialophora bantiana CBS 173.52]
MAHENGIPPKTDATHLEVSDRGQQGIHKDVFQQSHDQKAHRRLRHKIDLHMIPLGKILNVETGDSLLEKLKMSAYQYSNSIVITLFVIMYSALDVPSNWVLKRSARPSYWLGFLCFDWGALTLGFLFLNSFGGAAALRIFISAFEAGFYPGIVYIITFWYRQQQRSLRIALVSASSSLAEAFGGCIAHGVGSLNQRGGSRVGVGSLSLRAS